MLQQLILGCFVSLLFSNCSHKTMPLSDSRPDGKIIFLAYELEKDSASAFLQAKLLKQVITAGTVEEPGSVSLAALNDVAICFYDAKNNLLKQCNQKNPFIKYVEGVNAEGRLVRKEIEESRAEILLRTNYDSRMKKVVMKVYGNDKKPNQIFSYAIAL